MGRLEQEENIYLVERFKGAFNLRYSGKNGSIYSLPGQTFSERNGLWREEVVSEIEVIPIKEEEIKDAARYISSLIESKKLDFYKYPSRPFTVPKDDSDLVERAISWGQKTLPQIKKFHPHLLNKIKSELKR